MFKQISITLILLYLNCQAFALQVKPVKDNQTISAKISTKELSRIFVSNDRIQATRGISGAYELMKDEQQGMVFIKPTAFYGNRSFNLFVTTEHGHTYNLLLIPMNIPAESIQLKPMSPTIRLAERWEKNSPYVDMLIQLMNSMVNEKRPDGYVVVPVQGKIYRFPEFTMQLVTVYKGSHLQGEIWCIKNCTKKSLYLKPNQFFQSNTRAIALEDETLAVGEETYLYKVNNHD